MALEWGNFFIAAAGASAALGGFIIVAVSVSVDRMIAIPGMTSRAAAAIALLVLVAVVSLVSLIPHQPLLALGAETAVLGLGVVAFATDSFVRLLGRDSGNTVGQALVKGGIGLVPAVSFVVGGVLTATGSVAGLGFVAAGTVLALIVSVVNAWVVLVEIRR
ncbi:MAG: hypothetical protein V4479_05460 [Actinomycetota bacterium]